MSKETLRSLCQDLRPHIQESVSNYRKVIEVSNRVAIVLWRLGGCYEYRTIFHLFGVGRSSAFAITRVFCAAVVNHLLPKYRKLPADIRAPEVIKSFRKLRFLQCRGAIDGLHVAIRAPSVNA